MTNPFLEAAALFASGVTLAKGRYVNDEATPPNLAEAKPIADKVTCACTTGALMTVCGTGYFTLPPKLAQHFVKANAIYREPGEDSMAAVFSWNDKPERTVEEVVAALKKAGETYSG